jgi:hypothetical protein
MNEIIIRYNRKKSFLLIGIGLGLWCLLILGLFLKFSKIFGLGFFLAGGSNIYFGLKSFSGKPQLKISDEGLYIGFKFKKTIPWNRITKVDIKLKELDEREVEHLRVILKVNSGPSSVTAKEFPLQNLEKESNEIERLIKERLNKYQQKVQEKI